MPGSAAAIDKYGLTLKQRKQLEYYFDSKNKVTHGNQTASARAAGYAFPEVSACENFHKPKFRAAFEALIDECGLSDVSLIGKIKEGLNATKLQSCNLVFKKDEDGKFIAEQNANDFVEIEDYNARHKYLETALKLKRRLGINDDAGQNDTSPISNITIIRAENVQINNKTEAVSG